MAVVVPTAPRPVALAPEHLVARLCCVTGSMIGSPVAVRVTGTLVSTALEASHRLLANASKHTACGLASHGAETL